MNDEKNPQQCEATLCCRATAQLQMQVDSEQTVEDKSLAELLATKECDENQDSKE